MKKYIYLGIGILILSWFTYRFIAIDIQNRKEIHNEFRIESEVGAPVDSMTIERKTSVLKTPLYILDNRGLISGARINLFKSGEKIGDGKIKSVNPRVDLDTGMHVIKTSGVKDGLNYAEKEMTGFFVPVDAILDDSIFIAENNAAVKKQIKVVNKDADFAVITGDLKDGDIVILSDVKDGDKIKIK